MSYIEIFAQEIRLECGETGEWDRNDPWAPLWLSYALLSVAKGRDTTSEDVHDAWSTWAAIHHKEGHRSLIPFSLLSNEVQSLDDMYRDAIISVAS